MWKIAVTSQSHWHDLHASTDRTVMACMCVMVVSFLSVAYLS